MFGFNRRRRAKSTSSKDAAPAEPVAEPTAQPAALQPKGAAATAPAGSDGSCRSGGGGSSDDHSGGPAASDGTAAEPAAVEVSADAGFAALDAGAIPRLQNPAS